jgi:hypothetical protein
LPAVTLSFMPCVILPMMLSLFTTWSVMAMTSCPELPNRSTTSCIGRAPSDQVVWM